LLTFRAERGCGYEPGTKRRHLIGDKAPADLIKALKEQKVEPLSVIARHKLVSKLAVAGELLRGTLLECGPACINSSSGRKRNRRS
jgi:hypothetical protein